MSIIIKNILRGTVVAFLFFLGCVAGILVEQNNQKKLESHKESISTIAVVNMDEGVSLDEEHVNYASQLMSFPNGRFTVTGLNDAKVGIENGYYAAYIVIPETFSASVTSIENHPKKAILEYQYNLKLDEETRVQAVNDVNAFINLVNSNIAYMYIDAILAEFHRIQDDSAAILAHDNAELEMLQNVDAAQLIAATESIEEASVDFDVRPVELSSYTDQNDVLLEAMMNGYSESVQKGMDEYKVIQETNVEVKAASNNFFTIYNETFASIATEWSDILASGRSNLQETIGVYNQNAEDKRQEVESVVSNMMTEQLIKNQESANGQLAEILKGFNSKNDEVLQNAQMDLMRQLTACQTSLEEPINNLRDAAYIQGYIEAFVVLEAKIASWKEESGEGDEDTDVIPMSDIEAIIADCKEADIQPAVTDFDSYVNAIKEKLDDISIHWDSYDILQPVSSAEDGEMITENKYAIILPQYEPGIITDNINELISFFQLQFDVEEINDIIQTDFMDRLADVNQTQIIPLTRAMDVLDQEMEEYQNSLTKYDPLIYIKEAGLTSYLNSLNSNAADMLNAVAQNNQEYMSYSADVLWATTDNMNKLRNALDLSNKQTSLNVENCINDLIASRGTINSQNVSMLAAFTDSLKYTRVESRANTEVYDYIVNPIVPQRTGQIAKREVSQTSTQRNYLQEILALLLGIAIAVCIIEILLGFWRQYRKRQAEIRNVY